MSRNGLRLTLLMAIPGISACALNGAPAPQPDRNATPVIAQVAANRPWTETALTVHKGEQLFFTATGEIHWAATDARSGPDGVGGAPGWHVGRGGLVGRVGAGGETFDIGSRTAPFPDKHPRPPHHAHPPPPITAPGDGALFLGFERYTPGDNQGSYEVTIRAARR